MQIGLTSCENTDIGNCSDGNLSDVEYTDDFMPMNEDTIKL